MFNNKLDEIDINILAVLQVDGRIKNLVLAEKVNLSASPCLQRVKRLERLGYILYYGAEVDINKMTSTVEIFTEITISEHTPANHLYFDTEIAKIPEVIECFQVSGGYDYLTHFMCKSIRGYQQVIQKILDSDMKVSKYFSYVVMKPIVKRRPGPLKQLMEEDSEI
jgi:DNA-binding Lrp family transcriptional regulator